MTTARRVVPRLLGICATLAIAPALSAQLAPPPSQPAEHKAPTLADFPPNLRLGVRAASIQSKLPASDSLVIVPDESAFVAAIAAWSPTLHFPVLIDDGSWAARESIARFVRAYAPKHVLRWSPEKAEPLPTDSTKRRVAIEAAAAAAWDAKPDQRFEARLKEIQLTPPGVVVINDRDPAWTAGLALAAGRGQPIVWASTPNNPDNYCDPGAADALQSQITAACETLGYSWKDLGDELDSVTLCLNSCVKIFTGENDPAKRGMLALTDIIGRHPDTAAAQPTYDKRWAWCGQILGDAPRAAADAMSALFLTPASAWLFDGYPDEKPWNDYDATKAAQPLKQLGWTCTVDDAGSGEGQGANDWRWRAAGGRGTRDRESTSRTMGIDAGLIAVSTKGEGSWFDLNPGRGQAADVPVLHRPAMVYFVHSWSALAPAKRETIAARFIEHGAYAYLGSVHEPYLQGFVPTPAAMGRLAGGMPWGAAVRFDNGPAWKIAVFGDPLITIRPVLTRVETKPPLTGMHDVADSVAQAGKDGDYAAMMRSLSILGRDEDAVRLARALLKDKPDAVTAEVAAAGAMSAFIKGDITTLVALLSRCTEMQAKSPLLADMAWQGLYPVRESLTKDERDLLAASIRPDSAARDVGEVAEQIGQNDGKAAREDLIVKARAKAIFDADKKALEELFRQ